MSRQIQLPQTIYLRQELGSTAIYGAKICHFSDNATIISVAAYHIGFVVGNSERCFGFTRN